MLIHIQFKEKTLMQIMLILNYKIMSHTNK